MRPTSHINRIRVVSGIDAFGTGTVTGALAVTIAARDGLGALGAVLSVRLLAALAFAWWARHATHRSGALPITTLVPAVAAMTATSVAVVVAACVDTSTVVRSVVYFCFAATYAATALHVASRSPLDAVRLSSLNGIMLAVASSLTALCYSLGGTALLLPVALIVVLAQLVEIPLLRPVPVAAHTETATAKSSFTWGLLAAAVAFIAYAPLALAGGITTREFGAGWVPAAVLLYAAASLAAPVVHRRIGMLPWWTLGVWMCVANLTNLLIPFGIGLYLLGRMLSSGLMFAVDGTVRLRAFADGGTRALVAVGTGTVVGLSAAIPVFGILADRFTTAAAAGVFATLAVVFAVVARIHVPSETVFVVADPEPAAA
jgi:hypothetical protein